MAKKPSKLKSSEPPNIYDNIDQKLINSASILLEDYTKKSGDELIGANTLAQDLVKEIKTIYNKAIDGILRLNSTSVRSVNIEHLLGILAESKSASVDILTTKESYRIANEHRDVNQEGFSGGRPRGQNQPNIEIVYLDSNDNQFGQNQGYNQFGQNQMYNQFGQNQMYNQFGQNTSNLTKEELTKQKKDIAYRDIDLGMVNISSVLRETRSKMNIISSMMNMNMNEIENAQYRKNNASAPKLKNVNELYQELERLEYIYNNLTFDTYVYRISTGVMILLACIVSLDDVLKLSK